MLITYLGPIFRGCINRIFWYIINDTDPPWMTKAIKVKINFKKSLCKSKNWTKYFSIQYLKACVCYFWSIFYFFIQKIWIFFKFYLKSSFHSWDIRIFVIFSLPFHTFQIQKKELKWHNLWCNELAWINLQV